MSAARRKWTGLAIAAIFLSPIIAYIAWAWWDVARLEGFCADIHPGTPFSSIATIAEKHRIGPRLIREGWADKNDRSLLLAVPASSTMGDTLCAIHYDRDTRSVTTAEMWYD